MRLKNFILPLLFTLTIAGCDSTPQKNEKTSSGDVKDNVQLTNEQVENIVRRSYQYVAMYNINNKFALAPTGMSTKGWNKGLTNTTLFDHTVKAIARPNNDVLYQAAMLDLRRDAAIFELPAMDSKYVSMMATGYDHYVNIPMSTIDGDFKNPVKVLFYSARTEDYHGESIEGVDRIFKMSGDFVSVVLRIMPHANDKARFDRIVNQINSIKGMTLSEYLGKPKKDIDDIKFPDYGDTDADVFGNNLLEVMQFVFNHTTFDPNNELDKELLAAYKPLGVEPGKTFNPTNVAKIDGKHFREVSLKIKSEELARMNNAEDIKRLIPTLFQAKGQMTLESQVLQSVVGPIGLPARQAMYPPVVTSDRKPMNAQYDYVIRMTRTQLPPALGFWSLTLYDTENGFFIPNDHKKYSVGENAGMKLNADGGIEIYVSDIKPSGVPNENWLPINRKDEDMDIILRVYAPDLEKMKTWQAPRAEMIPMVK